MGHDSRPADAGDERIRRLFAWLDEISRLGGGQYMLEHAWARLASLLDASALEEDASRAKHDSTRERAGPDSRIIREAICQARQVESGSDAWWNSVLTARIAYSDRQEQEQGPP